MVERMQTYLVKIKYNEKEKIKKKKTLIFFLLLSFCNWKNIEKRFFVFFFLKLSKTVQHKKKEKKKKTVYIQISKYPIPTIIK